VHILPLAVVRVSTLYSPSMLATTSISAINGMGWAELSLRVSRRFLARRAALSQSRRTSESPPSSNFECATRVLLVDNVPVGTRVDKMTQDVKAQPGKLKVRFESVVIDEQTRRCTLHMESNGTCLGARMRLRRLPWYRYCEYSFEPEGPVQELREFTPVVSSCFLVFLVLLHMVRKAWFEKFWCFDYDGRFEKKPTGFPSAQV